MAEKNKTEGFLIKKNYFREKDETLVFFTKDFGKIEIIGRSICKME
ncbi:MAG: hypothetical protein ACPLZH_00785, partial [Minisyncoccales bacterium]